MNAKGLDSRAPDRFDDTQDEQRGLQATALIIVVTGAVYVLTRRSAATAATPAFDASA